MKSIRTLPRILIKRYYFGKQLTSYQKKLSSESITKIKSVKSLKPSEHVVSSILNQQENCEILADNLEHDVDEEYTEAIRLFRQSDDNFRKLLFYGTENSKITKTKYNCHGCGSNINCASMTNPGYIPNEVYMENQHNKEAMSEMMCLRCFFLSNNLDPLDISLDTDFYSEALQRILRAQESCTLLFLCDLTDLPNSARLPPAVLELLQQDKTLPRIRLVLLGNKMDLLQFEDRDSQVHFCEQLRAAAIEQGVPSSSIEHVACVSARSCQGIELLVDWLLRPGYYRNEPFFLAGSTNVGKSTLFNRLLLSDLCKTVARSHVRGALISQIPGTTLDVLRFPMLNVSPAFYVRRNHAKYLLKAGDETAVSSFEMKNKLLSSDKLIPDSDRLQNIEEMITFSNNRSHVWANQTTETRVKAKFGTFDETKITTKKWCYDTPGFINPEQLVSYVEPSQLSNLKFDHISRPRIYILKQGLSLIMQNLARIDILEAKQHVYLSMHSCLPVELVDTGDVVRYMAENDHFTEYRFRSRLLQPLLARIHSHQPDYDPSLHLLPELDCIDVRLNTDGFSCSSGDVVLSSLGWAGVSGIEGASCLVRIWTPAAIGCATRTPSLVPQAVNLRGHRLAHSREFALRI